MFSSVRSLGGSARPLHSSLDILVAAILAVLVAFGSVSAVLLGRWRSRRKDRAGADLLVLDAAYALSTIQERELTHTITDRDLDGLFDKVWWVHPLWGASPEHDVGFGPPHVTNLTGRHTVIQGPTGRIRRLAGLPVTNFLLSQVALGRRLFSLGEDRRIRVVQVGDPFYLGIWGLFLSAATGASLVVRVSANYDAMFDDHGRLAYPRLLRSRTIERPLARYVLSRTDLVLAVNRDNLEFALANGARPERAIVLPYTNMLHPLHFEDPARRGGPPEWPPGFEGPKMAVVSRLEPVKLVGDTLEVLAQVLETHPDVRLVLIGEGSQSLELRRRAEEMGLREAVWFAGPRPQRWIARHLPGCDVILSPLTGRALVEASLSGSPVVAYDFEWQSEQIQDGVTGLLVPHRDARAMAEAVADCLEDTALAETLGRAARERTLELMGLAEIRARERRAFAALLGQAAPDFD